MPPEGYSSITVLDEVFEQGTTVMINTVALVKDFVGREPSGDFAIAVS